jgi:hypothetical protein
MGFPTKVQPIKRAASEQWYINFPCAVAQAMEFEKGETVEWIISDKAHLILAGQEVPPDPVPVEKNASRRLKERFQQIMNQTAECVARGKDSAARLARHLAAVLLCSERTTITNIICTAGGQHVAADGGLPPLFQEPDRVGRPVRPGHPGRGKQAARGPASARCRGRRFGAHDRPAS